MSRRNLVCRASNGANVESAAYATDALNELRNGVIPTSAHQSAKARTALCHTGVYCAVHQELAIKVDAENVKVLATGPLPRNNMSTFLATVAGDSVRSTPLM
eukprot:6120262-Alexandrium_andersonii.AAC.1